MLWFFGCYALVAICACYVCYRIIKAQKAKLEGSEFYCELLEKELQKRKVQCACLQKDSDVLRRLLVKSLTSDDEVYLKQIQATELAIKCKKEQEEQDRLRHETWKRAQTALVEKKRKDEEEKVRLEAEAIARAEQERLRKEAEEKARIEREKRQKEEMEKARNEATVRAEQERRSRLTPEERKREDEKKWYQNEIEQLQKKEENDTKRWWNARNQVSREEFNGGIGDEIHGDIVESRLQLIELRKEYKRLFAE